MDNKVSLLAEKARKSKKAIPQAVKAALATSSPKADISKASTNGKITSVSSMARSAFIKPVAVKNVPAAVLAAGASKVAGKCMTSNVKPPPSGQGSNGKPLPSVQGSNGKLPPSGQGPKPAGQSSDTQEDEVHNLFSAELDT